MAEEKKVTKKASTAKTTTKKAAPKKTAADQAVKKAAPAKKPTSKKATVSKAASKQKNSLSVTLVKSFHGRLPSHRATVKGLGLKRIHHTVTLNDTAEVRGMINKVAYLLKVES